MRIFEIVGGNEKAAKATQRRTKARKKIADAQHRRSEASRRYQSDMRDADGDPDRRRDAGARYQDTLRRATNAASDALTKLREDRE